MSTMRHRVTPIAREQFLEALERGHAVVAAANMIGFARQRLYRHRARDPAFRAVWKEAYSTGTECLIDEVRRRGVERWDEPAFYKGQVCGHVRRYSDALLLALIRSREPSFRDNAKLEVNSRLDIVAILVRPGGRGQGQAGGGSRPGRRGVKQPSAIPMPFTDRSAGHA
jgi:hypothetical protein